MGKPLVLAPINATSWNVDYFDVNTLRLKTDFSKPQVVVYNDSYTTSWKAYVDGMPVELIRANEAFKGINVPAGSHISWNFLIIRPAARGSI